MSSLFGGDDGAAKRAAADARAREAEAKKERDRLKQQADAKRRAGRNRGDTLLTGLNSGKMGGEISKVG